MSFGQTGQNVPAEQWMDPDEVPDPKRMPKTGGLTTIVRPVPIRKQKGGIILPETYRETMSFVTNVGRVLHVSEATQTDSEYWPTLKWKVGDYVAFGKLVGIRMKFLGVKILLLNDKDVKCILEDPSDIDPMYNADTLPATG